MSTRRIGRFISLIALISIAVAGSLYNSPGAWSVTAQDPEEAYD